ncbi:MAG: selenoneine synthase SenA [bacterium]|nr:selenoneine synthase SenA [bacterium]
MQKVNLARWVHDARQRTFDLVADLTDDQLMGPQLDIVNPLKWEIGHIAWFHEKWLLRHTHGEKPIREDGDALYDSMAVHHDTRWSLPLPSREETIDYMKTVRDRVIETIEKGDLSEAQQYHIMYSVYHEDMHAEAFTYTRQTLDYPPPKFSMPTENVGTQAARHAGPCPGDARVPGGVFMLGSTEAEPFVFDNEKWAHAVELAPFSIARTPVTQAEYAAFADDGGYANESLWSAEGWAWRTHEQAEHPFQWKKEGGAWLRHHFDKWIPLEPHRPVIHVNYFEAEAYCKWAGRRLPTESEWEAAAGTEPAPDGKSLSGTKRVYPWGNNRPQPVHANLDWQGMGCVDVGAFAEGDSAFGCRQMLGNVWEWTSSVFRPFPGFVPDPYKDYSEPWFNTRKVLRGGAWASRSRLVRNNYRNYFTPDRRDVWAGFRTCAL